VDKETLTLLTAVRKELHAHPEVSEREHATQKRILSFLKEHTNADAMKLAKTGVMAIFDSNKPGPTILIRGDIDALPIQEINTFEHRSINDGVSHKCGHDGHTAILLGLAIQLTKDSPMNGKVLLLFQPAEENGKGAEAVLSDSVFKKEQIDYVFALHNLPGYGKNDIIVKENEFTANVKSIILKLEGKTAHAAEPEFGINPAPVIAEILNYAENHSYNHPKSSNFFIITPIYVTLGEKAYGIAAGYGEVHLTIRSWSTALMEKNCKALEKFIRKKGEQHSLKTTISWTQVFQANNNHPEAVQTIKQAAQLNHFTISENETPFKWGEDFGLFTQNYKGAMFGLGAGKNTPALHNPDYDFPDDIIPTGVHMFYTIINEVLKS
jgi:amidohydrolase